jgi:hypothetical protein
MSFAYTPFLQKPLIMNISQILKERDLSDFMSPPHWRSPIEQQAEFLFQAVYSKNYPKFNKPAWNRVESLPRGVHGMTHACRVALYIEILSKLYRRYNLSEAESVTIENMALLKIAALFHDAARLDDGEDLWDRESAFMCFHYLIKTGCDNQTAKMIAEVIANKDYEPGKFYYSLESSNKINTEIQVNEEGKCKVSMGVYYWHCQISSHPKSIFQKILHDADCLDIIRATRTFNPQFLNFFKEIDILNPQINYDISNFIAEIRRLIDTCGDTFKSNLDVEARDSSRKRKQLYYYCQNAYTLIEQILSREKTFLLQFLYTTPLAECKILPACPASSQPAYEYELAKTIQFNPKPSQYSRTPADHWNLIAHSFTKQAGEDLATNLLGFWPIREKRDLDPDSPFVTGVNRDLQVGPREMALKNMPDGNMQWKHAQPRHTPEEKEGFSRKTSATVLSRKDEVPIVPALFNFESSVILSSHLFSVGIIFTGTEGKTHLTSYGLMADGGTTARRQDKLDYPHENIFPTLNGLITALKLTGETQYNEVIARLKWTPDYKILYSANNIASRLLAKLRANDLWFILLRKNLCPIHYQVPIVFYDAAAPDLITNPEDHNDGFWQTLEHLNPSVTEDELLNSLWKLVVAQNTLISSLRKKEEQIFIPNDCRNNFITVIRSCFEQLPCHYIETIEAFSTYYKLPELKTHFHIFSILDKSLPHSPGRYFNKAQRYSSLNQTFQKIYLTKKEEFIQLIKTGKIRKLAYLDLSGADLQGINLDGANLERTIFIGAKLNGASMQGEANLRYADLRGAELQNTYFNTSQLSDALFNFTDISNTHFQAADLFGANFNNIRLHQSNEVIHQHFQGAKNINMLETNSPELQQALSIIDLNDSFAMSMSTTILRGQFDYSTSCQQQ